MKARPSARSVSVIVFFVSVTTNLPKLFEYEVVRLFVDNFTFPLLSFLLRSSENYMVVRTNHPVVGVNHNLLPLSDELKVLLFDRLSSLTIPRQARTLFQPPS